MCAMWHTVWHRCGVMWYGLGVKPNASLMELVDMTDLKSLYNKMALATGLLCRGHTAFVVGDHQEKLIEWPRTHACLWRCFCGALYGAPSL